MIIERARTLVGSKLNWVKGCPSESSKTLWNIRRACIRRSDRCESYGPDSPLVNRGEVSINKDVFNYWVPWKNPKW